jgi:hypothetical protein
MPAVFGTAELASTFGWIRRLGRGPLIAPTPAALRGFFASGCLLLVLLLCWPRTFFPFVWISVFFLIEPVNVWRKNRSLARYTAEGDWRPIVALGTGCLICGFFWELWNYYSYPKWVYQVPFVDFARVFEMPLLGYGGYLPFALELFALRRPRRPAVGAVKPIVTWQWAIRRQAVPRTSTRVVPMTAELRAMRFPYTIRVETSPQNGLSQRSVSLRRKASHKHIERPLVVRCLSHSGRPHLSRCAG